MDCACGHPIFQKADRTIIQYRGVDYYLHTGCVEKFFTINPVGSCIPTVEYLELVNAKKAKEAQKKAAAESQVVQG